MTSYRIKPIIVEATQWHKNGDHPQDNVGELLADPMFPDQTYTRVEGKVVRFFRRPGSDFEPHHKHILCTSEWERHGWIETLQGGHTVCPGDWIITDGDGAYFPVKASIFNQTYEKVPEAEMPGEPEKNVWTPAVAGRLGPR